MADETTIVEATPEDSWFKLDVSERFKSALKSGFMADLTVVLRDGNIRCHSNYLGISSPKFAAMIRKNQHQIKLPGIKSSTFETLLRIIYSEEDNEFKTDLKRILHVAKFSHTLKVYPAVIYCTKLLREHVNVTNVCTILDLVCLLEDGELKEECTKIIREKTDTVLKTDGFLACKVTTLEHILKQEAVHNITELELFQACERWANKHENPREALGSTLSLIRFRTFSFKDIAAYVKPTSLLTDLEKQELLWYVLAEGKGEMPAGFSKEEKKRHTTWSNENFLRSNERFMLKWRPHEPALPEQLRANPPLRISVNENAYLIKILTWSKREGHKDGDSYMEDVELILKDDKKTLIATAKFRGTVTYNHGYFVTFPYLVELSAGVIHELYFLSNLHGIKHSIGIRLKHVYQTETSLVFNVHEEAVSPICNIHIAQKGK